MKLFEYPQAIANLRKELAYLEFEVSKQQEIVKILDINIESQVANDSTLKNETQRKVKKQELIQLDSTYFKESNLLQSLKFKAKTVEIELLLLIDEFTVLKIEERRKIAQMDLMANV